MGLFSKFMSWLEESEEFEEKEGGTSTNEIKFGTYNGTPIVWIPVHFSMEQMPRSNDGNDGPTGDALVTPNVAGIDGRAYITKGVLFNNRFNEYNRAVAGEYNIWKTSLLRQYLNGEFYDECFSDAEKMRIVPCKVRAYGNTKMDASWHSELYVDEIETIDHVYLPNCSLRLEGDRDIYWTRMTIGTGQQISLRSKGFLETATDSRKVVAMEAYYGEHHFCSPSKVDNMHGVRPVIFIKK